MGESREQLMQFVAEDTKKYKGIMVPVKVNALSRLVIHDLPINKLHPNPEDEFCIPEVGPNYTIIRNYEEHFRECIALDNYAFDEPLVVEKVRPDGYMLLNGHHRWAAARNVGMKKVPCKIANVTHESDIKKMIGESTRNKRVTFDLDEVVFASDENLYEKKPFALFKPRYKDDIRLGAPALFNYFNQRGYDVWVFTSKYYSMEHIRAIFRKYNANVDGIITGAKTKTTEGSEERKRISQMIAQKYTETVNVDNESIVRIISASKDFEQYTIKDKGHGWSAEIMDVVRTWPKE